MGWEENEHGTGYEHGHMHEVEQKVKQKMGAMDLEAQNAGTVTNKSPGAKFDQGKLRWDLVPPEFEEVVKVLTFGAQKYADRNWENGISYGRLFAATMRHLWEFVKGNRTDPETGLHHLAHAACDVLFLLTYERRGMARDFNDLSQVYLSGTSKTKMPFNAAMKEFDIELNLVGVKKALEVQRNEDWEPLLRARSDESPVNVPGPTMYAPCSDCTPTPLDR